MHATFKSNDPVRDDDALRSPAGRSGARGWFRDPAVWAWGIVGLLALLPLRSALPRFFG